MIVGGGHWAKRSYGLLFFLNVETEACLKTEGKAPESDLVMKRREDSRGDGSQHK